MNYQKIYDSIIEKAQKSNRKKEKGGIYYEKHHIIPKCIGGNNEKSNIVLLTFKEHYLSHKLLYILYKNTSYEKALSYAFYRMNLKGNHNDIIFSGKFYEEVRLEFCKNQSEKAKQRMGHKHTEETKKKISLAHKGKILTKEHREKLKEYAIKNKERQSKITKENHLKGVYNNSNKMKDMWENNNFRKNISDKIKENYKNNPQLKEKISERVKKFRADNPKFNSYSKKVYFENIIFESMLEASIHANMKYPAFVWNLKNNTNFNYSLKAFNFK